MNGREAEKTLKIINKLKADVEYRQNRIDGLLLKMADMQEALDKTAHELLILKEANKTPREKNKNDVGCKVDEDVCVQHDSPLKCEHGCCEAKPHACNSR